LTAETSPEQGSGGVQGDGCGDALPLRATDRSVTGDTFAARDDVAGKCGGARAPDVIYRVDLPARARVSARFEREEGRHVFVVTRGCADRAAEVACGTRIDEVLASGTYFVAVDGQAEGSFGKFTFDWRVREVTGQETACKNPPSLVDGQTVSASTAGQKDKWTTSCGGREEAQSSADRMYKLVLAQKARVRLLLTTPTWDGVLALRKSCVDAGMTARVSEVACNNDHEDAHHSKIEQVLEAGTYYVLVDGHAAGNEGAFTLEYKILK
jgi:hypothetical protein